VSAFPHRSRRRVASVVLPITASLLAVAGCSAGPDSVAVDSPSPSPSASAAACRALHAALPGSVDGLARRPTRPSSRFTAAWGDPALVLRCGVRSPDVLTPGNAHYDPTSDAVGIDGVDWLPQKEPDGSVRATTTLREAFVEVTIPAKYAGPYGDLSALTDLADAVSRSDPTGL
jgi:hypothetical protein